MFILLKFISNNPAYHYIGKKRKKKKKKSGKAETNRKPFQCLITYSIFVTWKKYRKHEKNSIYTYLNNGSNLIIPSKAEESLL